MVGETILSFWQGILLEAISWNQKMLNFDIYIYILLDEKNWISDAFVFCVGNLKEGIQKVC